MNNDINKVLFIVNKFAGSGYQTEIENQIIEVCSHNDCEFSIAYTQGPGHATMLARQAVNEKKFTHVVAVGGDGTVNETAQGLLHSDIPMGIIPKGSGNGLARHLRIPMKMQEAAKYLFKNHIIIAMDTFQLNGKLSLNVSGIGFDGHIANLFGSEKQRGFRGYAKHVFNEFFRFKEFEAEIETEENTGKYKAFIIAIANASQYGNNARIAPAASVCDQRLHINILRKVPPYRVDFIYSFFTGTIDRSAFCNVFETDKLTIRIPEQVAYHIDGEPCGSADRFMVQIVPSSLRIIIPEHTLKP